MPLPQCFSSKYRISKADDFTQIFTKGRKLGQKFLTGFYCRNDYGYFRLGISIGKKFGNACERNRWKRLIREAFRIFPLRYQRGVDLIIISSKNFKTLEWNDIQKDVHQLMNRILTLSP